MLPRPCEELATVVDDASTVTPKGRAEAFPTQVVERPPMHAQQLGGFKNREEGTVELIAHGDLLMIDQRVSRHLKAVNSDSDGPPANESRLSQEVAISAHRQRQPASEMMAHRPLQSRLPVALDVLDTIQDDGDIAIARTGCPAIECHQCVSQLARSRRPLWRGTQA